LKYKIVLVIIIIIFSIFCLDIIGGLAEENNAIDHNISKSQELYYYGNTFYYQGKYEEAVDAYDQAISLNLKYIDAWFNKGLAFEAMGRNIESIEAYDEVIKFDPNYSKAFLEKGVIFIKLYRYKESIVQFDNALNINPNFAEAWYNKGVALYHLKDYENSLIMYNKFLDINHKKSKNKIAWNNKGIILYNLGRYNEAIDAYDKAIELDPTFAWPWNNKGITLGHIGKYSEALEVYDKAIELDPASALYWNNKGATLSSMGKYSEALKAYENATKLDQKFEWAWNNKGVTLSFMGMNEEAIVAFDRAISIDPNQSSIYYNKGLSLINLKKYYESVNTFNIVIELNYSDKNAWLGKNNAWLALNQSLRAFMASSTAKGLDMDDRLKRIIYAIFLFLYISLLAIFIKYFVLSKRHRLIPLIILINVLNFIAFCWIISGLFNVNVLALFVAIVMLIVIITISLIAFIGIPENISKNNFSNYLNYTILKRGTYIFIIAYPLLSTIFYFRYGLIYEEDMLLYLRISFLMITIIGLISILPILIGILSSSYINKDLRNVLIILQFSFILIISIYLSLTFWILGLGSELFQISPLLLGITTFLLIFTFLLPYLIGWKKERRIRELLLNKQRSIIEKIENVLIRPTPSLYIAKLKQISSEVESETDAIIKKLTSNNTYNLDEYGPNFDCLMPLESDPQLFYLRFLQYIHEEINEMMEIFLKIKEENEVIEKADIYVGIYSTKKENIIGNINIEKSSKPVFWIGLTFILSPFLSIVISNMANLMGPKIISAIIIKLVPVLIQGPSGLT